MNCTKVWIVANVKPVSIETVAYRTGSWDFFATGIEKKTYINYKL